MVNTLCIKRNTGLRTGLPTLDMLYHRKVVQRTKLDRMREGNLDACDALENVPASHRATGYGNPIPKKRLPLGRTQSPSTDFVRENVAFHPQALQTAPALRWLINSSNWARASSR